MNAFNNVLLVSAISLGLVACGSDESASQSDVTANIQSSDSGDCNRACLIELASDYVAALLENDPSAITLADEIAFVENVTPMAPGEGLWDSTISVSSGFAITVPDVELQQVGYLGMMSRRTVDEETGIEGAQPVIVAIRLQRNEESEIAEAEHLVAAINNPTMLARLQTPRAGLITEVPEGSRMPREELAAIGMSYYDALDDNDGSLMPFAEDCQRHENGMITAGPEAGPGPNPDPNLAPVDRLCAGQLDSQTFAYIDNIHNRRLVAVDPVTGLVMGLSHFNHPMENLPYDVIHTDGSTSQRNADNMPFSPFDLPAAHIFKIGADGLVHEIEAMGFTAPLNSPTGWE